MQRACTVRTPAMVAKARAMWDEGLSLTVIAERLGTSRPTVKAALGGAAKERAGRMTDAIRAEIIRLRSEGVSKNQIARLVGFANTTVRDVLSRVEEQRVASSDAHLEGGNQSLALAAALPPKIKIRLSDYTARMRDSFKARGMSHEDATREAMRVGAGSAVDGRGASRAAGGEGVSVGCSFHAQSMEEAPR